MPHLVLGNDAGGCRWFLDDRPVHAGSGLELRLPGNDLGERWARVRFEMTFPPAAPDQVLRAPDDQVPVLYLYIGHRWEQRFHAVEAESVAALRPEGQGRWAVYDRKRDRVALTTERTAVDGEAHLVYPDLDADTFSTRAAALRAAEGLQAAMEWHPEVVVHLPHPERVELRWPATGP